VKPLHGISQAEINEFEIDQVVTRDGGDEASGSAIRDSKAQPIKVVRCAGVPITPLSRAEACALLIECALDGPTRPMDVHLCNAYTLSLADKRDEYRALLNRSGLNLPDGISIIWANRLFQRGKHTFKERVRGTDLFLDMFDAGNERRLRHYLLGSTPEVLVALTNNLHSRFPGVQIVGAETPPYRELTNSEREQQLHRILTSEAQVVWVGLGTPKQDIEAADLAGQLSLVFIAIGAAFDFVAGSKAEAPVWMQRAGLEWFHRLISEPRRLWRRYLLGNFRFLWAIVTRK
jgi:N-acetylglucosaminyldiphosphoundecaprenol N-acetyl-beta-D-mannosaminyltransferase